MTLTRKFAKPKSNHTKVRISLETELREATEQESKYRENTFKAWRKRRLEKPPHD